jgi:hypothetical protein
LLTRLIAPALRRHGDGSSLRLCQAGLCAHYDESLTVVVTVRDSLSYAVRIRAERRILRAAVALESCVFDQQFEPPFG